MAHFRINGQQPLDGEISVNGAKNAALKFIAASLMFDGPVTLTNVPNIEDVRRMLSIIAELGATVAYEPEKNYVRIDPCTVTNFEITEEMAKKIRTSIMLVGPLLWRFGKACIGYPGGCVIGRRPIDLYLKGYQRFGAELRVDGDTFEFVAPELHGMTFIFPVISVVATETFMLMASRVSGTTVLKNAAQEPEIDDLIDFLNEGGARISRNGSIITIVGVATLSQSKPYTIAPDKIEAATYAVLGIASGGDVTVSSIPEHFIKSFNETLIKIGAGVEDKGNGAWRYFHQPMIATDIETGPYPEFVTDWQPLMAVLLTQAKGVSTIHERIFENRFSYMEELRKLGAKISYIEKDIPDPDTHYHFNFDPEKEYQQTIQIQGMHKLHGAVLNVSDLRAGATLAIAALISKGQSYIHGIHHLQRGYEHFVEKVKALGGDIQEL